MTKETILVQRINDAKTYKTLNKDGLSLCDPITQLYKRIEAFFKKDSDITCRYIVNNSKGLGPKINPDTGEQMTKRMTIDGEDVDVLLEEDHYCEMRIFCKDYEKAQCMANVIRHRHSVEEFYEGAFDDNRVHLRMHYLIVHVCTLNAIDPDGPQGGSDPWNTDDDTDQGVKEIYGLEPIDWEDSKHSGCNERLAPSDTAESDIPKGYPEEYEQKQWEATIPHAEWKWKWLQKALSGNKNIVNSNYEFYDGENMWRFIECNYIPIAFAEDNLTALYGINSILAADLIPLVFATFGAYQISTYARKENL